MKENLQSIGVGVFWILFMGLWINGCVHSNKKHKDDGWVMQESPLAVYRGVEYFWHDDYAGVNWKDRIADDAGTAIQLILASNSTIDIASNKKQMDELAEQIAQYPADKRNEIKKVVNEYLTFVNGIVDDFAKYADSITLNDNSIFKLSDTNKQRYDTLNAYYKIGGMETMKKLFDSMAVVLKSDTNNIQEYKNRIRLHNIADAEYIQKAYEKIFKEKMP